MRSWTVSTVHIPKWQRDVSKKCGKIFKRSPKKRRSFPRRVDIYGFMNKTLFFHKTSLSDTGNIWAKTIFQSDLNKNVPFFEMLIFSNIWTKNYSFKVISKQTNFIEIFIFIDKKTIFSKWSQCNVLYLEILIFTKIWTKNVVFVDKLIFSNIMKTTDLKKTSFFSKCWYFRIYEQKLPF